MGYMRNVQNNPSKHFQEFNGLFGTKKCLMGKMKLLKNLVISGELYPNMNKWFTNDFNFVDGD